MTHILCFSIQQLHDAAYDALYARASRERQEKADRYRRHEDKLRCIAGEALLRCALGTSDYTVAKNPFGKPYITGQEDFHFNLSHSGDWVVLAYGDREVGIDIQQIRMDAAKEKLARRYFTQKEQDYVFRGDAAGLGERFFRIWTAKESYLKFLGTGLSKALNSFDVLDMDNPRFVSQILEDCCLTLCAEDPAHTVTILTLEQLITP